MKNMLLTNDGIYADYMNNYEDSLDFFEGTEIKVTSKEEAKKNEEIEGLEQLVLGFNTKLEICGNEGVGKYIVNVYNAIIQLFVDSAVFVKKLIFNRLARVETRIKNTEQRRKINGLHQDEVSYPSSIKRLMVPAIIDINPSWVITAAKQAYLFYEKTLEAQKIIQTFITKKPTTKEELSEIKNELLSSIGSIVASGHLKAGLYQTTILPGRRIYSIRESIPVDGTETPIFFSESPTPAKLKKNTWLPSYSIIEDGLKMNQKFMALILKNQTHIDDLVINFKRQISKLKKEIGDLNPYTKQFFHWISDLNKKLVSSSIHYIISVVESLDDFVNMGINRK